MSLPEPLKLVLYNFLDGEISISELEQWINANHQHFEGVPDELQFELISFDYRLYNSTDKMKGLIRYSMIDQRDYSEWRLKKLLNLALDKEHWKPAIWALYWECWDDNLRFRFLRPLCDLCAPVILKPEPWGIPDFQGRLKEKIEQDFLYPEIFNECARLLSDINSGSIRITGENEYIDNRVNVPVRMSFEEILDAIRSQIKDKA